MVIYAPVDTYSGYGANARDKVKSLYNTYCEDFDIKIISCNWGNTRKGFIKDNPDGNLFMNDLIINGLTEKPYIMVWITVPNEVQNIGEINILFTAGIETTICEKGWIEGCNKMNLIIVPSEHSKNVFENTVAVEENHQTKLRNEIKLTSRVEVIPEGVNLDIYKVLPQEFKSDINLSKIKEDFCYLFVGHWLPGDLGEDRKNVGLMVKIFLETFKNKKNPPALILKTSGANNSHVDARTILHKIHLIKSSIVNYTSLPNVYVLHGDFTDTEMNEIYNNKKVKCMISLTKGEGYGRPLSEFCLSNKPIIASGWSGHTDFLDKEYTLLVNGNLTNVHQSASNTMILKEAQWFSVDILDASEKIKFVFDNYKQASENVKRQSFKIKNEFSFDSMCGSIKKLLDSIINEENKKIISSIKVLPKI